MKHFFIIAAVIAASLCSCNQRNRLVILAAEEVEYNVEIGTVSLVSDTSDILTGTTNSMTTQTRFTFQTKDSRQ